MVRSDQRRLEQAKPFALLLAVATALALVSVAQGAAYLAYAGKPIPWAGMLKGRLTDWYLCALFVPLLYRLAVTRPIHRKSWVRVLPLHLGAGLGCAFAKDASFTIVANWFRPGVVDLPKALAANYLNAVLIYAIVIAALQIFPALHATDAEESDSKRRIDRFVVTVNNGYRVVPVDQVEWIDAQGNYAELKTAGGRHLVRATMRSLERRLGDEFLRVHRGAIVNRSHIDRIEPRSHGAYTIRLSSGDEVVTSRSYGSNLRAMIG